MFDTYFSVVCLEVVFSLGYHNICNYANFGLFVAYSFSKMVMVGMFMLAVFFAMHKFVVVFVPMDFSLFVSPQVFQFTPLNNN